MASQWIKAGDSINLITKKFDSHRLFIGRRRINFDHVAADTETSAREIHVVALVEHVDEPSEHSFTGRVLSPLYRQQHPFVILGRGDAVDAGNTGYHDNVAPAEKRTRGRQTQALDLFVNGGVLFDVSIGTGDVGFRLVVIEVADEVLDRVARETLFELRVKLRGQRFVVRNDQGRPIDLPNDIRHCECLAGAGHAKQSLMPIAHLERLRQFGNRLPLVAPRSIIGFQLKRHPII